MPSTVASFRVDDKDVRELKRMGRNLNEFAKEAFERKLAHARIKRSIAWFEKHPMPVVDSRPVEDIIRELRDSR